MGADFWFVVVEKPLETLEETLQIVDTQFQCINTATHNILLRFVDDIGAWDFAEYIGVEDLKDELSENELRKALADKVKTAFEDIWDEPRDMSSFTAPDGTEMWIAGMMSSGDTTESYDSLHTIDLYYEHIAGRPLPKSERK